MNDYSNISREVLINDLIFQLEKRWKALKWWQKLMLSGIYQEVLDILTALRKQGYGA